MQHSKAQIASKLHEEYISFAQYAGNRPLAVIHVGDRWTRRLLYVPVTDDPSAAKMQIRVRCHSIIWGLNQKLARRDPEVGDLRGFQDTRTGCSATMPSPCCDALAGATISWDSGCWAMTGVGDMLMLLCKIEKARCNLRMRSNLLLKE